MKFRGLGAALVAAALLWASPGLAGVCGLTNFYVLKDGNSPQYPRQVAAVILPFPDCRILPASAMVDTAGNPLATAPTVAAPNGLNVQMLPGGTPFVFTLPAGAATSANQATAQTTLGSILSALGSALTVNLPTGASTSAAQTTAQTTLTSILAKSTAIGQTATNGDDVVTGGLNGTPALASGGSGYVSGDIGKTVTLVGGTPRTVASVTIATLSGGAVATFTVANAGVYSAVPSNAVATTGGGTTGSGLTLTAAWAPIAQVLFSGATPANGFKVGDPNLSDDLWISDATTTPTVNGAHSQKVFANGGQYATEPWEKPVGPVYLIGPTIGDVFTARGS